MKSIILLILLFSLTYCLKLNNFCELVNEKKGLQCNRQFKFKCSPHICSTSKTDCFEHKQIIENLKLFSKRNETNKYFKEMIKYKVVKNTMKKCEIRTAQNWMFYLG